MKFLSFLEKYEKEDVSKVRGIVESQKKKEKAIMREAFSGEFPSKKEALFKLKNEFISESTAPKTVDVEFFKENFDALVSKVENLTEGDIKIIIHNHEHKAKPEVSIEDESVKRRGRPKKTIASAIYGDNGEVSVPEVISDEVETEEEYDEEALIEKLSDLDLSDEELKEATDIAESGEIKGEGKIKEAAEIISKINAN